MVLASVELPQSVVSLIRFYVICFQLFVHNRQSLQTRKHRDSAGVDAFGQDWMERLYPEHLLWDLRIHMVIGFSASWRIWFTGVKAQFAHVCKPFPSTS